MFSGLCQSFHLLLPTSIHDTSSEGLLILRLLSGSRILLLRMLLWVPDLKHSGTFYHCSLPLSPRAGANIALFPAFFKQHILPKPTPEWRARVFCMFPNCLRSTKLLTHLRPGRSDSKGKGKHLKCISITGENKCKLVSHSISLSQMLALHPSFPSTQKNISD